MERYLTLWIGKVNDVPVLFEHVNLLDRLDGLHVQFLERGLQLLVVGAGALVHFLHLSPRRAFAADPHRLLHFG